MEHLEPLPFIGIIVLASCGLVAAALLGRKIADRMPPMLTVPVQTLLSYATFFTVGVALLAIGGSIATTAGMVLTLLGLSIFLPESWGIRFIGAFVLLLGLSLIEILQTRANEPWLQPSHHLSDWKAGVLLLFWGLGVLFAWRRWYQARSSSEKNSGVPPIINGPNQTSNRPANS